MPAFEFDGNDSTRADFTLMASRSDCSNRSANARHLQSVLLQRIARVTQTEVAAASDIEKTAMHRIVAGDRGVCLDELYDFMAAIGMAVIECGGETVSIPESEYQALVTLAKKGLDDDRRNRRPK